MTELPDTNEFLRLLMANQKRIYAFILAMVPNHGDAEDLFQETVLQMWSKFGGFTRGTSFAAWGIAVARYQILNARKRHSTRQLRFSRIALELLQADRDFSLAQDWSVNGADTLVLFFRGRPLSFLEPSPGAIVMSGAGEDIYGTADEFRFVYKALSGDGAIVAKVESLEDTNAWAKVGVMIRATLDPGSRYALVCATPGNGVRFQARLLNLGGATSDTPVATAEQIALQVPVWIKVERSGDEFNGLYSTDGATWTAMSWNPQTIGMMSSAYIGLAVTSHAAGVSCTGEFSGITTSGGVSGSWQTAEIGVAQPSNTPAPLYVAVQDSGNHTYVVTHPDASATVASDWQPWAIPLDEFRSGGVDVTKVKRMYIGVGDRTSPQPGGAGRIYIDDIGFGHAATSDEVAAE